MRGRAHAAKLCDESVRPRRIPEAACSRGMRRERPEAVGSALVAAGNRCRCELSLGDRQRRCGRRGGSTASAVLATSVLLDSAMEHYRGNFHNPAMFTPLVVVCACRWPSARTARGQARRRASGASTGLCAAGGGRWTARHRLPPLQRPKKVRVRHWQNLFYAAPIGAPDGDSAVGPVGDLPPNVFGTTSRSGSRAVLGLPAGRVVAATTAWVSSGPRPKRPAAFSRRVPQSSHAAASNDAAGRGRAAAEQRRVRRAKDRNGVWHAGWLGTAAMGVAGVAFHAYGVLAHGRMAQLAAESVDGPPLPAPPAFTGLALAGLAALACSRSTP